MAEKSSTVPAERGRSATVYRLAVLLVLMLVYALQKAVELHAAAGAAREWLGYLVSLAVVACLVEFGAGVIGQRWFREESRLSARGVLLIATGLLGANLGAKEFHGVLAVVRRGPKPWVLGPLLGAWGAWLVVARRRGLSAWGLAAGLAGLVVAVRLIGLAATPFDRIVGDMLATIDRSLDLLFAGKFPYVDFPPPMPYWPGMFLAYAPAKWLGLDLRVMNLLIDGVGAAGAVLWWPRASGRVGTREPAFDLGQVAFPLFLLWPTLTYYGVSTQFPPCILGAALLARAMAVAGPRMQGVALGLAVGSNQMFLVLGPVVACWWLGRYGWRRAVGACGLAGLVLLAMLGPFLAWDAEGFSRITLGSLGPLGAELMAGRFTVWPLVEAAHPKAPGLVSLLVVGAGCGVAFRVRRGESAVLAAALVLAGVLLLAPRSFSHYLLPAVAMVAAAPLGWGKRDDQRIAAGGAGG